MEFLRRGKAPSHAIILLQAYLRRLGFLTKHKLINAVFGREEEQAVISFQRSRRIVIDGLVGPQTWHHLSKAMLGKDFLFLFVHCTASLPDKTAQDVLHLHLKIMGWSRPGYRFIAERDKTVETWPGGDFDMAMEKLDHTWGTRVFNRQAQHICYIGGIDRSGRPKDTRNGYQKRALEDLVRFYLLLVPDLIIAGHNQVQRKGCPCFDTVEWLRSIGIADKNIALWGKLYR